MKEEQSRSLDSSKPIRVEPRSSSMTQVKSNKILLIAGIIIVSALAGYFIPHKPVVQRVEITTPSLYKVVDVTDGDTIKVDINNRIESVRFIGVDTPETVHPTKPKECYGEEASKETTNLLINKSVYLIPDPQNSDRDNYGRLLRYVFLPDGTFINAKLISEGYAFNYIYDPFEFMKEFDRLEKQAKSAKVGLWGACGF